MHINIGILKIKNFYKILEKGKKFSHNFSFQNAFINDLRPTRAATIFDEYLPPFVIASNINSEH
jgi:hypothetical protein